MAKEMERRVGNDRERVSNADVYFAIRYLDPEFHRNRLTILVLKALLAAAGTAFVIVALLYLRGGN